MKQIDILKIITAAILGIVITILFQSNMQILVFLFATMQIFIFFELAEKRKKKIYIRRSKFAKDMEKFKNKL